MALHELVWVICFLFQHMQLCFSKSYCLWICQMPEVISQAQLKVPVESLLHMRLAVFRIWSPKWLELLCKKKSLTTSTVCLCCLWNKRTNFKGLLICVSFQTGFVFNGHLLELVQNSNNFPFQPLLLVWELLFMSQAKDYFCHVSDSPNGAGMKSVSRNEWRMVVLLIKDLITKWCVKNINLPFIMPLKKLTNFFILNCVSF